MEGRKKTCREEWRSSSVSLPSGRREKGMEGDGGEEKTGEEKEKKGNPIQFPVSSNQISVTVTDSSSLARDEAGQKGHQASPA